MSQATQHTTHEWVRGERKRESRPSTSRWIAGLLVAIGVTWSILVPGAGVDTRRFDISGIGAALYNVLMTALVLACFFVPYFVIKRRRWAVDAALIAAVTYIVVCVLDMTGVVPRSPDSMPTAVTVIESLDMALSVVVVVLCLAYRRNLAIDDRSVTTSTTNGTGTNEPGTNEPGTSEKMKLFIGLGIAVGVLVVIVATRVVVEGG